MTLLAQLIELRDNPSVPADVIERVETALIAGNEMARLLDNGQTGAVSTASTLRMWREAVS